MKRKMFFAATVLTCLIFLTGVGAKQANAFDISFDGYCDGMNLNLTEGTLVWGHRTGCSSRPIIGDLSYVFSPKEELAFVIHFTAVYLLTYYIYLDGTWESWVTDGASPTVKFLEGTWSIGQPTALKGGAVATDSN